MDASYGLMASLLSSSKMCRLRQLLRMALHFPSISGDK